MKFDKLIEDYVEKMNIDDFLPVCDNIHPVIEEMVTELEDAEDFKDMWKGRLSLLQQHERHCLASELKAGLMVFLPPAVREAVEKDLQHILLYAISAAWVVHPIVADKFGEGK